MEKALRMEKLKVLSDLNEFIKENMDNEENANEVSELIDRFTDKFINNKKRLEKSKKKKSKRRPTYYNHWLINEFPKIKKEQPSLPKNEYMKEAAKRWCNYKEQNSFKTDIELYKASFGNNSTNTTNAPACKKYQNIKPNRKNIANAAQRRINLSKNNVLNSNSITSGGNKKYSKKS
jgi:23S rRNA maturation mini-RNase III